MLTACAEWAFSVFFFFVFFFVFGRGGVYFISCMYLFLSAIFFSISFFLFLGEDGNSQGAFKSKATNLKPFRGINSKITLSVWILEYFQHWFAGK